MTLSDETRLDLMRLCDGELEGERARAVAARCREDREAAAFVAGLEADRALLRAAFPVEAGNATARTALESAFAARRRRAAAGRWRPALPIAASVVITVLLGAGGVFLAERRAAEVASATVAAAQARDRALMVRAFGEALDRQVSGAAVDWRNPETGSSGAVMPLRTFRAADGRWCREYEERVEQGGAVERRIGIACREAGRWRLEFERPAEA
jgi:surface antigen